MPNILIGKNFATSIYQYKCVHNIFVGDTTVITASNDDNPGVQTGSAYVFRGFEVYFIVFVVKLFLMLAMYLCML